MRFLVLCALTGCFSTPGFHGASSDDTGDGDAGPVVDTGPPVTNCEPFGAPTALAVSVATGNETEPVVTRDGLQLFFERDRLLMTSLRGSITAAWPEATPVVLDESGIHQGAVIDGVWVTDDPRQMWLSVNTKIKHATRGPSATDPYEIAETFGTGNGFAPALVDDQSLVVFDSGGLTGGATQHFALFTRTMTDPNNQVRILAVADTDLRSPSIGNRGTTLVWASVTASGSELVEADWTGTTLSGDTRGIAIGGVTNPTSPFLTDDGKTLYFSATMPDATADLFVATRSCP